MRTGPKRFGARSPPASTASNTPGLATAPEYPPDIIALLRERTAKMSLGPLWWTPTVEGLLNYEYFRDNPEALDDPAWQEGLPKDIVDDVKKSIEHPGSAAVPTS